MASLEEAIAQIGPLDAAAMDAMRERLDQLTKPRGSLGRLEDLAIQLAGIAGTLNPSVWRKTIIVAAADHGVVAEGVSAYPSDVTGQMLGLFAEGRAAINVLARQLGAEVVVVDAGVAHDVAPTHGVLRHRIGAGTANFLRGPAMSSAQARAAVEAGIRVGLEAIDAGAQVLVPGDMGIGNTTSAAAVVAAITECEPAAVVGRGTGLDDEGLARKTRVIQSALALHHPSPTDPLAVLTAVGGFEIGVLAGVILAAAAGRVPAVLDGVVSGAAALLACGLAPGVRPFLIAGHCSTEPAHHATLGHLSLEPLLDLRMRLGEGTGAALALGLLDAAVALPRDMWTFEEAGVSEKV